ncbi:MAG: hypothetical protein K8W52_42200, partial [Deltaproteobacteria bacterium]|nr:hypothetical protein [Deltaproteobacteria bacterium]
MLRNALVAALVAAIPATGCFHTQLAAPPPGAALPERLAAYQQLRPAGEVQTVAITTNQYGTSVSTELDLVLAGGEDVRHADDLLPVVDPQSPTARSARESADARGKKWGWVLGGTAVSVLGFGVMMSGISESANQPLGEFDSHVGEDRMLLGGAIAVAAALAGTIGGYYYGHVERRARAAAFANYGDGLRA